MSMLADGTRDVAPNTDSAAQVGTVRVRNAYLDNLKFVLIYLVVLGHLIEPVRTTVQVAGLAYTLIYAFHMPAFVFLAGMTSKETASKPELLRLIALLLTFQFIYSMAGGHFLPNLLRPYWLLWFLFSLVIWRLALPVFNRMRRPLLVSALIAVGAGYFSFIGYDLSLSRTLVFLPFFVAGHSHGQSVLEWFVKERPSYFWAFLIFAVALEFALASPIDVRWLYGSFSYGELGSGWQGGLIRAGQLVGAGIMMGALFILVPAGKCWFTAAGERTLSIYLLHGLFVMALRDPIRDLFSTHQGIALLATIGASVLIMSILFHRKAHALTHTLTTPAYRLLTQNR